MAFALLATVGNMPKENVVKLMNVELNTSRAGALTCLKRMGANIETVTRREKFGDVFGDVEIYSMEAGKRLQGRRFSEDVISTGFEEYAFLAVAACFAEGETILRLPKESREAMRPVNEFLAENLRKTGVEVGVYDDGLVIRGMETIVNGNGFDGGQWPQMGLALGVLSLALQNDEPVQGAENVEKVFPGVLEKLKQVLVAEASEKESQA
jgi:5-enolpyruvylshikimate-3-phosphate synthase